MPKLTSTELVQIAITWAEESMLEMIRGCDSTDPYRADVADQLKQLRAYRRRRFGKPINPLAGAELVSLDQLRRRAATAPE